jgi:signal transduction histidine kinase
MSMLANAQTAPIGRAGSVLLALANEETVRQLAREIEKSARAHSLLRATNVAELRASLAKNAPAVTVVEEPIFNGVCLIAAMRELCERAPVILLAPPTRQMECLPLIASGALDFVSNASEFVPLAASLVERRLRWAEEAAASLSMRLSLPWAESAVDFAELFRHEINNPLTGILGNAELVLSHRDRLPAADTQRLETVVDLAVRLRETIRRVSSNWEVESRQSMKGAHSSEMRASS